MWKPDLNKYSGSKYKRIVAALSEDINNGVLKPNEKLPPNRELADELGISLGTVAKALHEAKSKGLISGQIGRGTFIREYRLDQLLQMLTPEIDQSTIDLSLLIPPVFTNEVLKRSLISAAHELFESNDLHSLLGYQPHAGNFKHREIMADWVSSYIPSKAENILLCQSSQNALSILLSHLTDPGDSVMCESLTDPGLLDAAQLYKLKLVGLAIDEQGIIPTEFEKACQKSSSKILYCIPTLHNPTTAIMPAGRRKAIAEIASRNNITIIENGTLNPLLREDYPAVSSFAPERSYFFTSFSKCLSPAFRLGIIRSGKEKINDLNSVVRSHIWMASPIIAELISYLLHKGNLQQIINQYLRRAEKHLQIAEEYLGKYRYKNKPTAYHMWLDLPEKIEPKNFYKRLKEKGVTITSAEVFAVNKSAVPKAVRIGINAAINEKQLRDALKKISNTLEGF